MTVLRMILNALGFYFFCVGVIESSVYVCHLIENILVPEAYESFALQRQKTKEKIRRCGPNIPIYEQSMKLYFQRRYKRTSVLAIHVSAADLIPNLIDEADVPKILIPIYKIIDKVIVECGLFKVTEFSGMYIAAACGDPEFSSSVVHDIVSHKTKAVQAIRKLRIKINEFNQNYGFCIKIGLGLKQGSVFMGFFSERNFLFDLTGETRDIACSMAVSNDDDDAVISADFSSEVKKTFMSEEVSIKYGLCYIESRPVEVIRLSLNGDSRFNRGLELKDFEYKKKLGEGGYGSVHLLKEKYGGGEYAVKSIRRNRAGSNSKMIQREFSIFQQMNHPNVVSFKYCLVSKTKVFYVMDYVAGGNLNQVLDSLKCTSAYNVPALLKSWFAELVLALEYIHSLGIIHRCNLEEP